MEISPLCCETITSHFPVKNRIPQYITAIVAIIVSIFVLIISIVSCFVSAQFGLSNLILNTIMSLVLFIVGLNYLIDQHKSSDDGDRFFLEIASRDQKIESLREHVLRYQAQIADLEAEITRLNKYVGVLEKENIICAQKYFAELESREQYEKYVCLLSKRLQDTIRHCNRRKT